MYSRLGVPQNIRKIATKITAIYNTEMSSKIQRLPFMTKCRKIFGRAKSSVCMFYNDPTTIVSNN